MSTKPYVIVGGGHAGRRAAEALRELDDTIGIVVLGAEPELPYDRPVLSKDALLGMDGERKAYARDAAWYEARRIEVRTGNAVESLDRASKCVRLVQGPALEYERLVLTTGSRVRRLDLPVDPGVDVHYVRTVADSRGLRGALVAGKRVVVLGGGFIGLEVAASAATLGCHVTVVEPAPGLVQRALPPVVGHHLLALHTERGVQIWLNARPLAIRRDGPRTVIDTDHGALEADIVVVGIGVIPNTELAQAAGLEVANGIAVDEGCRTNDPDVFAAGEVTMHFNPLLGRALRVESWQVAENQPAVAAANMLGGNQSYAEIPWLWSDQYDCNLQMLGLFDPAQTLVTRGAPGDASWSLFGLNADGSLGAMAAVNAGRDVGAGKRLMNARKVLNAHDLADTTRALRSMI